MLVGLVLEKLVSLVTDTYYGLLKDALETHWEVLVELEPESVDKDNRPTISLHDLLLAIIGKPSTHSTYAVPPT